MTKKRMTYERHLDAAEKELVVGKRRKEKRAGIASKQAYEVGYGRPPVHGQIKPGEVRNQNGRPKGSKNKVGAPEEFYNVILEEARREVPLGDGSGGSIPMQRAIVRSTNVAAVKGNTHAQRLSADMIRVATLELRRTQEIEIATAMEYKNACALESRRRERLKAEGPEFLPNPDHVEIDLAAGCVWIRGPATEHEKIAFARWHNYQSEWLAELSELKEELDGASAKRRPNIKREIDRTEALLTIVGHLLRGNRDALQLCEDAYARLRHINPGFDILSAANK